MERQQRELFDTSRRRQQGENVKDADVKVHMEDFWKCFPSFDPSQNTNYVDLFRPRAAHYRRKMPLKPPKPVLPTKVSLDLLPDQERSFRAHKAQEESSHRDGLIICTQPSGADDDSDDDMAWSELDVNERIGGVTTQDLVMLCEDWDLPSLDGDSVSTIQDGLLEGEWDAEEANRPRKKPRTNIFETDLSMTLQHPELSFEEPERAAAKVAKVVALDMNDPHLLIDEVEAPQKPRVKHAAGNIKRNAVTGKGFGRRYNVSNDEAYDMLKENHQHKIRSTVGSNATEHSLPAARLQYPFYKVSLDLKQKRSFHRPPLEVRDGVRKEFRFARPKYTKRKHMKGKSTQDIYHRAEDLSIGDNSNVLLLEYSEEAPIMMSNFGMGSRFVNYYRKTSAEDSERPKRDIGDTQVLLPLDKGPFANFGHVDAGEVVPTIQNGLYRAPVFNHKPKSTDFLVNVSSTYMSGHRFYIRNVENLHTVGQQFPSAEVPAGQSRKVTNAAKNRLRSLAFRLWTKYQDTTRGTKRKPVTNDSLLPHLPGHDMPQLRSKMREFMKYDKGAKDIQGIWIPQPSHPVWTEEKIRQMNKPDDICLLDSMQVGLQHHADLGIPVTTRSKKQTEEEQHEVDDAAGIEHHLAPWQITNVFLAATAGKAMMTLHGEGDPTGRGEGFSFVHTSMKGTFKGDGESAQDKITAKKRRDNGGHSYNVAQQQKTYDDSIRAIWEKQKASLSNEIEPSDVEPDEEMEAPVSAYPHGRAATPRSSFGTPAMSRYDDESASQFSRGSAHHNDKVLTIARSTRDDYGNPHVEYEKVTNPRVIQLYRKRKLEQELMHSRFVSVTNLAYANGVADPLHSFADFKPTGDVELDNLKRQQLAKEIERVTRNQKRRNEREAAKTKKSGNLDNLAGSPGGPSDADGSNVDGTPQKANKGRNKDGTARKCANCGQVGHIKTNRKSVQVTFLCSACKSTDFDPTPLTRKGNPKKPRGRRADSAQPDNGSLAFAQSTYSEFRL